MSVFAIISIQPNSVLDTAVQTEYPNDSYRVANNVWFVADAGVTTQGVCKKLGIDAGGISGAIAITVDNYWGRAPKTIWEWLSVKASDP
jgi:hypothetical protein